MHGRTRTDLYRGEAEYDTIRAIKQAVSIPVVANGDIDSPEKARYVLDYTGVDAVMIGRAAQGRPWIFREIRHFLETGTKLPPPEREEVRTLMNEHVTNLHQFYGAYLERALPVNTWAGIWMKKRRAENSVSTSMPWIVQMHNSRHSKRISMD